LKVSVEPNSLSELRKLLLPYDPMVLGRLQPQLEVHRHAHRHCEAVASIRTLPPPGPTQGAEVGVASRVVHGESCCPS
jgi:hypothetical protein